VTEFDVEAIDLTVLRDRQSIKYRAYGADVIPAWIAEMDFPLAEPIARALHDAIDRSDTGYPSGTGLREAFSEFAARTWQWDVPAARVIGVPDVLSGVEWAIRLLTAPGDGVVINTPVYPPFFSTIRDIVERTIVEVPLARSADGAYSLDLPALAEAFARPDVTALLLCSPHNPTGTVPSRAELEQIASLAHECGVVVIADEIHAPLVLAGAQHTPYLSVAGVDANAVALVAASKAWNLPGLKCAQLVATERTAPIMRDGLPKEVVYATGHLGVIATVTAYREGDPWLQQVLGILDRNRILLGELLAAHVPRAGYVMPEASYLAWVDLRAYDVGDDPSERLLKQARVALNAGPTFGPGGAGHVRLNMATSPAILTQVVERIGEALGAVDAVETVEAP
jgi:cystathionine beta-lyase